MAAVGMTFGTGRLDQRVLTMRHMTRLHDGPAELTFADCASVVVPPERVLFTMTDNGEGALWIGPGTMPNMTEIETALESGPFTLKSEGVMQSCKAAAVDRQGSVRLGLRDARDVRT